MNSHCHKCTCGHAYTKAQLRHMPRVGNQDDGDGGYIVLVNCSCGTTFGVYPETLMFWTDYMLTDRDRAVSRRAAIRYLESVGG